MKAILATTMVALLALAGFLFFQFSSEEPIEITQSPAPESTPAVTAEENNAPAQNLFTPAPINTEVVAEEAAPVDAVASTEVVSTDDGQINESLLPQPNRYDAAMITGEGREIITMNKGEVMSALNNGADQMMALREQIKQAKEIGALDEVKRLKKQHNVLETELVSLANRGVSLNNDG